MADRTEATNSAQIGGQEQTPSLNKNQDSAAVPSSFPTAKTDAAKEDSKVFLNCNTPVPKQKRQEARATIESGKKNAFGTPGTPTLRPSNIKRALDTDGSTSLSESGADELSFQKILAHLTSKNSSYSSPLPANNSGRGKAGHENPVGRDSGWKSGKRSPLQVTENEASCLSSLDDWLEESGITLSNKNRAELELVWELAQPDGSINRLIDIFHSIGFPVNRDCPLGCDTKLGGVMEQVSKFGIYLRNLEVKCKELSRRDRSQSRAPLTREIEDKLESLERQNSRLEASMMQALECLEETNSIHSGAVSGDNSTGMCNTSSQQQDDADENANRWKHVDEQLALTNSKLDALASLPRINEKLLGRFEGQRKVAGKLDDLLRLHKNLAGHLSDTNVELSWLHKTSETIRHDISRNVEISERQQLDTIDRLRELKECLKGEASSIRKTMEEVELSSAGDVGNNECAPNSCRWVEDLELVVKCTKELADGFSEFKSSSFTAVDRVNRRLSDKNMNTLLTKLDTLAMEDIKREKQLGEALQGIDEIKSRRVGATSTKGESPSPERERLKRENEELRAEMESAQQTISNLRNSVHHRERLDAPIEDLTKAVRVLQLMISRMNIDRWSENWAPGATRKSNWTPRVGLNIPRPQPTRYSYMRDAKNNVGGGNPVASRGQDGEGVQATRDEEHLDEDDDVREGARAWAEDAKNNETRRPISSWSEIRALKSKRCNRYVNSSGEKSTSTASTSPWISHSGPNFVGTRSLPSRRERASCKRRPEIMPAQSNPLFEPTDLTADTYQEEDNLYPFGATRSMLRSSRRDRAGLDSCLLDESLLHSIKEVEPLAETSGHFHPQLTRTAESPPAGVDQCVSKETKCDDESNSMDCADEQCSMGQSDGSFPGFPLSERCPLSPVQPPETPTFRKETEGQDAKEASLMPEVETTCPVTLSTVKSLLEEQGDALGCCLNGYLSAEDGKRKAAFKVRWSQPSCRRSVSFRIREFERRSKLSNVRKSPLWKTRSGRSQFRLRRGVMGGMSDLRRGRNWESK